MKGKIFRTNLTGVGQERDFYKITEMRPHDIELLRGSIISKVEPQPLRELVEAWLTPFETIFALKRVLEQHGVPLDDQFDKLLVEMDEDHQSRVEGTAVSVLRTLLKSEEFCLDEAQYTDFCLYLMTQYFRTNRMKQGLARNLEEHHPGYVQRSMGAIRHVFATLTSFNLFAMRETMKARMVLNRTDIPFLTGDQPVINLRANPSGKETAQECDFYYPISPFKAIVISKESRIAKEEVEDTRIVRTYNQKIVAWAECQIYAQSRSELDEWSPMVGAQG